jgi:ATP-dependent RNA helicase DDX41
VEAVATHGGKDQEERDEAVSRFKKSDRADVLIATDVAAKGLDFPDVQHVINFDMPEEIENYVHRIGRTGRCGKTGVATTFINKSQDELILRDLKMLLVEAKQRIPPVLAAIEDDATESGDGMAKGCAYCGGLGHRIINCPKLESEKMKSALGGEGPTRDYMADRSGMCVVTRSLRSHSFTMCSRYSGCCIHEHALTLAPGMYQGLIRSGNVEGYSCRRFSACMPVDF